MLSLIFPVQVLSAAVAQIAPSTLTAATIQKRFIDFSS
jgi:hypothetical protein